MNHRKSVGIAFGGGVVRGLAHLGVLRVLMEAGIPIDYVSGTSAGSIIGAAYCSGAPLEKVIEFGCKMSWRRLARPVFPRQGFVSFDPLAKFIERNLGKCTFAELEHPLAVIATDLDTGEPVEFTSGPLGIAVQASCSVPGLVQPVCLNGTLLGDGSLSDTVPVRSLRKMGAEFVIGVDIFTSSIRPRWGPFGMGVTAIEILVQRAGGGIEEADCLIRPDLKGASYLRFSQNEKLIAAGEKAARGKVEEILRAID